MAFDAPLDPSTHLPTWPMRRDLLGGEAAFLASLPPDVYVAIVKLAEAQGPRALHAAIAQQAEARQVPPPFKATTPSSRTRIEAQQRAWENAHPRQVELPLGSSRALSPARTDLAAATAAPLPAFPRPSPFAASATVVPQVVVAYPIDVPTPPSPAPVSLGNLAARVPWYGWLGVGLAAGIGVGWQLRRPPPHEPEQG